MAEVPEVWAAGVAPSKRESFLAMDLIDVATRFCSHLAMRAAAPRAIQELA
jgi:hypothetical protein